MSCHCGVFSRLNRTILKATVTSRLGRDPSPITIKRKRKPSKFGMKLSFGPQLRDGVFESKPWILYGVVKSVRMLIRMVGTEWHARFHDTFSHTNRQIMALSFPFVLLVAANLLLSTAATSHARPLTLRRRSTGLATGITRLRLIDSVDDRIVLDPLVDGSVYYYSSSLPSPRLTVEAVVDGSVGSVKIDGRTENAAPYARCGDQNGTKGNPSISREIYSYCVFRRF